MRSVRPLTASVFVVGLLLCVTGCSGYYHFNLFCEVRNAADYAPLEGVHAVLDEYGQLDRMDDLEPLGEVSGPDGVLYHRIKVASVPTEDGRRWLLKLTKDGFHPEVVDITPSQQPKGWGEANAVALPVQVKLRPVAEKR